MRFGSPRLHLRRTGSTNAIARGLAEAGAPNGTVITAGEQRAGRGRQGRTWFAPPGSALLYSAVLRPLGERPLLPLAVPLAVAEAVESLAPVACRVKWPNDIWIEDKKLAGVLIEARPDAPDKGWAVIGVGVNVAVPGDEFPAELRGLAASVGNEVTVEEMLVALNQRLPEWIDAEPRLILKSFGERDALAGREVAWDGGSGVAAGVDSAGHLLVTVPGGSTVALGAGDVHLAVP